MPPILALLIWLVLLLALLIFDPARDPETSVFLWVPVVWMFFLGSRSPSIWLGLSYATNAAAAFQEGNPVDRAIFSFLILLSVGVLISRGFQWGDFFMRNSALMAFLLFALLSVMWSGFPFITFKKWGRDLGEYLVVLVVLTDPHPVEAIRTVLRRLCYLLIPLSIVLIKYFPHMGIMYGTWSGGKDYTGVTTGKNLLGLLCAVGVIFFVWDTITRWPERKERRTKRIIMVNVAFIAMALWLLPLAHTVTSDVCVALSCFLIFLAHSQTGQRHSGLLKTLAPALFIGYVILAAGFGMASQLAEAVGKNASMGDRTLIWQICLSAHTNPLLGTGYESFWLGSRMKWFDSLAKGANVHEAHNGYLAVYLDLGLIGLFLLGLFLIASYRTICKRLKNFDSLGSLSLALWTTLVFFNVTEAGFEMGFMWIVFMVVALVVPERVKKQWRSPPPLDAEDICSSPYEMAEGLR